MILQHLFKPAAGPGRVSPGTGCRWTPPPPGTLLVSSDAAVSSDRASSAAGVVVQDHSGLCVAAASEPLPGVSSPELAEALALRRAAALAR